LKCVTIRFDDDDHEFLREYSFKNRVSINQIVVSLVKKLREDKNEENNKERSTAK